MIRVRPYERNRDYPIICKWWEKHGLSVIPYIFLPIGFIVSIGGTDIAAGWVHMDKNSPMCWINWLVTNPDATPKEKHTGFNTVIDNLIGLAEKEKYSFMAAFFYQKSIQRLALKRGFMINHQQVAEMFIGLSPQKEGA